MGHTQVTSDERHVPFPMTLEFEVLVFAESFPPGKTEDLSKILGTLNTN